MSRNAAPLHMQWSRLLAWFLLGILIGIAALSLELSSSRSDLSDILRVGETSALRTSIEANLGPIQLRPGTGHDGQYSYMVARDPFALGDYSGFPDAGYRFRRALYGWFAGGFGLLPARSALWGLAVWGIIGMGLASAAMADIADTMGARTWATAGVLANIGLWLSVQLATPDALAMGLSLAGVALVLRSKVSLAAALFAAAVLTKDTFILFPLAIAAWLLTSGRFGRALAVAGPAVVALLLWSTWLTLRVGDGFSTKGNIGWPFVGIWESLPWSGSSAAVLGLLALTGVVLAVAGFVLGASPTLRWLIAPWVVIALVSTALVWDNGNNAARALAPCWTLGLLALAHADAFNRPDSLGTPSRTGDPL